MFMLALLVVGFIVSVYSMQTRNLYALCVGLSILGSASIGLLFLFVVG